MSVVDQQEQTAAPYGPMGGSTTSEMGTPAAATKVQTPVSALARALVMLIVALPSQRAPQETGLPEPPWTIT